MIGKESLLRERGIAHIKNPVLGYIDECNCEACGWICAAPENCNGGGDPYLDFNVDIYWDTHDPNFA